MAFVHEPVEAHPADCTCGSPSGHAPTSDLTSLPDPPKRTWIPLWIWPVLVGSAALGACIYTAMHDPNTESSILPPCPFKAMTGFDCPGCGMTRGVYALMKGDPLKMLNHNILLIMLLPAVGYGFLRWTLQSFGKATTWQPIRLPRDWMNTALVVLVIGFWVVRNLPGPLSFLNATA